MKGSRRTKKEEDIQKRRNITLSDRLAEEAKKIDGGNVSKGIRLSIEIVKHISEIGVLLASSYSEETSNLKELRYYPLTLKYKIIWGDSNIAVHDLQSAVDKYNEIDI